MSKCTAKTLNKHKNRTFPLIARFAKFTCLPVGSLSSQLIVQMLVYIYLNFKVNLESVLDDFKTLATAMGQR